MNKEEASKFKVNLHQNLVDKKNLILQVTVLNMQGAEFLMNWMYDDSCAIEGLNFHSMDWNSASISNSKIDEIIEKLQALKGDR